MYEDGIVMSADFPVAMRGYAKPAVDDFVERMGERINGMQKQLTEKTELAERLQGQLEKAQSDLAAYVAKETAIANAVVGIEKRRVEVEVELEGAREEAKSQAAQIVADARTDADAIIAETLRNSEELVARAEAECIAREQKLRQLCADYDETAARIRRALEAHLSLLPAPGASIEGLSTVGMALTAGMGEQEQTQAA